MSLNSKPYKGTRDYYPNDKRLQNYIFKTWRQVAERFGYEEYGAPLVEPIDIYAAKTGQEIVNEQTYNFTDRGGRNVAIRPEMTPSVSRMVADKRQELAYPARWYSVANFMRYERPQHGREREFWQLNVDIFGADSIEADAEMIIMSRSLMQAFGASDDMYTIKVNNRKLINFMTAEYLELDAAQAQLMVKLLDRREKISADDFDLQVKEIFGGAKAESGAKKVDELLNAKTMADLPAEIRDSEAVKEVQALFTLLTDAGVSNAKFDISLMRGFDYYTGIVFEVFDNHPDNRRSMFGGGRYDGLVGLFGVDPIATVGMAPGGTTTEEFLRSHKLLPHLSSSTDVYIIVLGEALAGAKKLAASLRAEKVNVELDVTNRKVDKQIKTVLKKKIPFMIFVGEQELADDFFTLKTVATEKEQKLSPKNIATTVKAARSLRASS